MGGKEVGTVHIDYTLGVSEKVRNILFHNIGRKE